MDWMEWKALTTKLKKFSKDVYHLIQAFDSANHAEQNGSSYYIIIRQIIFVSASKSFRVWIICMKETHYQCKRSFLERRLLWSSRFPPNTSPDRSQSAIFFSNFSFQMPMAKKAGKPFWQKQERKWANPSLNNGFASIRAKANCLTWTCARVS